MGRTFLSAGLEELQPADAKMDRRASYFAPNVFF
jgi:hypothetical protein